MTGTFRQTLDILKMTSKLVGQTKNIYFDSGIYAHADLELNGCDPRYNPEMDLFFILRGTETNPITVEGIIDILNKMQVQIDALWDNGCGIPYYYKEIIFDEKNNVWRINWNQ